VVRQPLEYVAAREIGRLPRIEAADLVPGGEHQVTLAGRADRHAWSLGFAEQVVLQLLVRGRGVQRAFEIGTFNGGTTRLLAESLPVDGVVVTIDLPDDEFDRTQHPDAFRGSDVGTAYRSSPARDRIRQERGDSLTFDFSAHFDSFDLVLVDGAHDYEHGFADSETALRLARPGAIVLWDDFEPYWHGLVRGIVDATRGRRLCTLAGTSLAVLELPS
jgi:predicted O-methyltransferase YrrM